MARGGPLSDWRTITAMLSVFGLLFATGVAARVADEPPAEVSEDVDFEPVRIAGPFEFPWSLVFLPGNEILVTERPGRLQLLSPNGAVREITGLPPIQNAGLAGLLDVAIDPDFTNNRIVYLSYLAGEKEAPALRVLRAQLDLVRHRLTQRRVIFETAALPTEAEHYGGRMALTRDGLLFLSLGDRGVAHDAQNLSSHVGKIVRIRTDGSVPHDNPFTSVAGAKPDIWSYGHRNPQGLVFDEDAGRLWSHEHGPMGGDELNLVLPGRNYGWPVITHGLGYDGKPIGEGLAKKEGMEQPIYPFEEAVAPSGLAIERAGSMTVFWIGTLAGQSLFRLEAEDDKVVRHSRFLHEQVGRIRDVRIGPDGLVYVLTDDAEGALYRLDPVQEQAREGRGRGRL
jgi:aldose sugar dehydrogenase